MFTNTQMRYVFIVASTMIIFIIAGAVASGDWKYRAISSVLYTGSCLFVMAFVAANSDKPRKYGVCRECYQSNLEEYENPNERGVCVFCSYQEGEV